MKRRQFLVTTAVGGGLTVALSSCGNQEEKLIPLLISDETVVPGAETWVPSLCQQCPAGCGLHVRVMHGEAQRTVNGELRRQVIRQAKKLEGNPAHPINRGKICARGQAGVQTLYNPDRVQTPLRNVGARGAGQFQAISWDEAIDTVAAALQKNSAAAARARVLWLAGPLLRGYRRELIGFFLGSFQPSSLLTVDLFGDQVARRANLLTTGQDEVHSYDLERTNYLISFGAPLLEAGPSPVRFNRGLGSMRQDRPGRRAKFVHVEPRLSLTAANADEWLAAKPGTEGALALGLAHVIIKENLYNAAFVSGMSQGFEEFKTLVESFSPEQAASVTGLRKETIERVARELAGHGPALAVIGGSAAANSKGPGAALAVNSLNALVGAYGPDGAVRGTPYRSGSETPSNGGLITELAEVRQKGAEAAAVMFLSDCDPVHVYPASLEVKTAFERVPLIVSFSSFLDDSTLQADLVLPDHTPMERWVDDVPEPGVGVSVRTLGQPVVKPLYDTRDTADVVLQISKKLGGATATALPADTFEEYLKSAYEKLFPQWKAADQEDFSAFWDAAISKGGVWREESSAPFQFAGASNRYDFRAGDIRSAQLDSPPAFAGEGSQFPYLLQVYPSNSLGDGRYANSPWLQEAADPLTGLTWNSWVEINSETAERLHLTDGDVVEVQSPHGKLEAAVYVYPGVAPDAVAMPMGQGHVDFGRYARERGINPVDLLAPSTDPATGSVSSLSTRVSLTATGRRVKQANLLGVPRTVEEQHLGR
ncbi:MAG: molybdopterin-dependent oxidoreductase [Acidobacteria bacterium]|nr:molybdopterin-dependent oxidoreductase [Acidobacteriota bacterium]